MKTEGSLSDRAIKTFAAEIDRLVPGGIMTAYPTEPEDKHIDVHVSISVQEKDKVYPYSVAGFSLMPMPGCCGILVSTGSFVHESWRGRGIGKLMQTMKEWFARELKVGCLLATVVKGNQPEENLLRKTGWRPVSEFVNPKTGNTINVWKKEF